MSHTEAYKKHTDCGYRYKIVCCYDDKYNKKIQIYRGENAVYNFMKKILEEVNWKKKTVKKHFNKPLIMSDEDKKPFSAAE